MAVARHPILGFAALAQPLVFLHRRLFFLFVRFCLLGLLLSLIVLALAIGWLRLILVYLGRGRLLPSLASKVPVIVSLRQLLEALRDIINVSEVELAADSGIHALRRITQDIVEVALGTAPYCDHLLFLLP